MLKTLTAVLLALVLVIGGSAATVAAAQDDLPGQALYPLKTFSEDTLLSLATSPQARLGYALDFSDRRVDEISALQAAGEEIPQAVETRLQQHLDLALHLAAGLEDAEAIQQLAHIRQRAETQLATMTMLMAGAPETVDPVLSRAQARLQNQVELAAMGESDPQTFRAQEQERFQAQEQAGESTQAATMPQGPGPQDPTGTPQTGGSGNGDGPGGNGPGDGTAQPSCTPQPAGTGDGSGQGGGGDPQPGNPSITPGSPGNGEGQGGSDAGNPSITPGSQGGGGGSGQGGNGGSGDPPATPGSSGNGGGSGNRP